MTSRTGHVEAKPTKKAKRKKDSRRTQNGTRLKTKRHKHPKRHSEGTCGAITMLNPVRVLLAWCRLCHHLLQSIPIRDILPDGFHCHAVPVAGTAAGISSLPPHSLPLPSPAAACRRSSANKTPASKKTPDPCFRSVSWRGRYAPTDYFGVRLVEKLLGGKR